MTRVYKDAENSYSVQDRLLCFWWVHRTAQDSYGNDLPCTLSGFSTLQEAIDNCQTTPIYIHSSCLPIPSPSN